LRGQLQVLLRGVDGCGGFSHGRVRVEHRFQLGHPVCE